VKKKTELIAKQNLIFQLFVVLCLVAAVAVDASFLPKQRPACKTIYDTVYSSQCSTTYGEECSSVPSTSYETKYEQQCSTSYEKQCQQVQRSVPDQQCSTVHEQQCTNEQQTTYETTYQESCKSVPTQVR
jgi:hypothetical protein